MLQRRRRFLTLRRTNSTDLMHVGVYYNNKDVRIEDVPTPKIGRRELLVRVEASGICGSDVMEWYRIKKAPRVLGHEITGEIVSAGSEVANFKPGERVFVSHHVPCNTCHYCLSGHHTACSTLHSTNYDPGGFSEYIRIPEINVDRGVFLLPDEISFEDGSFIEPLACVVRGQRMAGIRPGNSVLIIGSGISGIIHIQLARALGAGRIIATDINEYRLNAAKQFGADIVITAEKDLLPLLHRLNNGRLIDFVIVCAGAVDAINQALKSVDRGGTILFFAPTEPGIRVPVDINYIWSNDITFKTSYGAGPEDIVSAIELIRTNKVNLHDMITHKLPLSKIGHGFKLAAGAMESLKIIIEPGRL